MPTFPWSFIGKFDLIGGSHLWWHLLILAAMAYWHWSGIQLLTHYHLPRTIFGANHTGNATSPAEQEHDINSFGIGWRMAENAMENDSSQQSK